MCVAHRIFETNFEEVRLKLFRNSKLISIYENFARDVRDLVGERSIALKRKARAIVELWK